MNLYFTKFNLLPKTHYGFILGYFNYKVLEVDLSRSCRRTIPPLVAYLATKEVPIRRPPANTFPILSPTLRTGNALQIQKLLDLQIPLVHPLSAESVSASWEEELEKTTLYTSHIPPFLQLRIE